MPRHQPLTYEKPLPPFLRRLKGEITDSSSHSSTSPSSAGRTSHLDPRQARPGRSRINFRDDDGEAGDGPLVVDEEGREVRMEELEREGEGAGEGLSSEIGEVGSGEKENKELGDGKGNDKREVRDEKIGRKDKIGKEGAVVGATGGGSGGGRKRGRVVGVVGEEDEGDKGIRTGNGNGIGRGDEKSSKEAQDSAAKEKGGSEDRDKKGKNEKRKKKKVKLSFVGDEEG